MREFKLRLPRLDEVKGENRLSVIKTRGAKANPTEFANRMGCKWDYYIKDNIKEGKRGKKVYYRTKELICGNYYLEKQDIDEKILKSIGSGSERWEKEEFDEQIADKKKVISIGRSFLNQSIADDELSIIDGYGRKTYRDIGVRLVMQMDEKDFIPTNEEHLQRAEDGVLEVELGYLPKRIVKDGKEYYKRVFITYEYKKQINNIIDNINYRYNLEEYLDISDTIFGFNFEYYVDNILSHIKLAIDRCYENELDKDIDMIFSEFANVDLKNKEEIETQLNCIYWEKAEEFLDDLIYEVRKKVKTQAKIQELYEIGGINYDDIYEYWYEPYEDIDEEEREEYKSDAELIREMFEKK